MSYYSDSINGLKNLISKIQAGEIPENPEHEASKLYKNILESAWKKAKKTSEFRKYRKLANALLGKFNLELKKAREKALAEGLQRKLKTTPLRTPGEKLPLGRSTFPVASFAPPSSKPPDGPPVAGLAILAVALAVVWLLRRK